MDSHATLLAQQSIEQLGLYPTIALATVGVFVLAYLIRGVENYIRHLHGKTYLPFAAPRFLLTIVGCALVLNGFLISSIFQQRLPLHAAAVTTSCGLLCLIASGVWSIVPHIRQMRRLGRGPSGNQPPSDYDDTDPREPPAGND